MVVLRSVLSQCFAQEALKALEGVDFKESASAVTLAEKVIKSTLSGAPAGGFGAAGKREGVLASVRKLSRHHKLLVGLGW